jgi:hypothetical protein
MKFEEIERIVSIASRVDTSEIESLFRRRGGRIFLETTILIIVNSLPLDELDKRDYLKSFMLILDKMEERIKHQKQGEKILKEALKS